MAKADEFSLIKVLSGGTSVMNSTELPV